MDNRCFGSVLAGYWDQCKSSFATRTGGDHVTVHKFQNSRGNPPPCYYLQRCGTSKHKHRMNYESLSFSRQPVYQASLHRSESCAWTLWREHSHFQACSFLHQYYFSQEIIVCRIPNWKGHDSTVKSVKTMFPGLCSLHWRSPPPLHLIGQGWKGNIYHLNQQWFLALKQQPL